MNLIESGLVPIYDNNGERAVDARELHAYMDVGRDFSTWIKEKLEKNGFQDGIDYSPISGNIQGRGQPRIEYALSIDAAKEIAMMEGNERGRQVRRYFIECEKRLAARPVSVLDALAQTVATLREQQKQIAEIGSSVQNIKDIMLLEPTLWRKEVQRIFNSAVQAKAKKLDGHPQYEVMYTYVYDLLEERAHVSLNIRLTNRRNRMAGQGASRTDTMKISYLDVIEEDPKLKEIYTAIVKELAIKWAA